MSKYVVAFISFHDNILTQEVIEAESEFDAIKKKMGEILYGDETTVEELKCLAFDFDCDCMVSAVQI